MAVKRERISRTEAKAKEAPAPPVADEGGRLRAKYARLGAFGLLMAGLGGLIIVVTILAAEGPSSEDFGLFAIVTAIALAGAGLSWRFGTWSKIVGIVATLAVGLAVFWTVFLLANVTSPVEFTVGLLIPPGILLSLGGHIAALVQKRRGNVTTQAPPGERRAIQGVGALVVLGIVVSVVGLLMARESVAPAAAAGAREIRMTSGFSFDRETLAIPAGESAKVLVHNSDVVTHTFTVPELGIDETLVPGSEVLVEIEARAGTYVVYCKPHSDTSDPNPDPDEDMVSRLVVG